MRKFEQSRPLTAVCVSTLIFLSFGTVHCLAGPCFDDERPPCPDPILPPDLWACLGIDGDFKACQVLDINKKPVGRWIGTNKEYDSLLKTPQTSQDEIKSLIERNRRKDSDSPN
jgi:hypothetical protein